MLYNPACIVCYRVRNKHQVVCHSEQGTVSLLHRTSMQIIARVVVNATHLQKPVQKLVALIYLYSQRARSVV